MDRFYQRINGQIISANEVERALNILGFDQTDTNVEQTLVLVQALDIFQDHTDRIGEMWRTVDALNTAHHIKHKADRTYHAERYETEDGFALDSALDLINYAVFYVRQKEE